MRSIAYGVLVWVVYLPLLASDGSVTLTPKAVEFKVQSLNEEWKQWDGIAQWEWQSILSMAAGPAGEIWIGTSDGRLLSLIDDKWSVFEGLQTSVRSVAVADSKTVWLSTSDGIRRLEQTTDCWSMTTDREYYEGSPTCVGLCVPAADSNRLWGHVDKVYCPSQKADHAPFAVSKEHGLFSLLLGNGWFHYLPHYWGANSPWLDLRTLVPHRRPTCVVEDRQGNLWIGSQWDGIVRLNAHARDYWQRPPTDNRRDGTEFTFIDSKTCGVEFDEVTYLAPGLECGIWAILARADHPRTLARFDGKGWNVHELQANDWLANCIQEIEPGVILVGRDGYRSPTSLSRIDWETRTVQEVAGPTGGVIELASFKTGRIIAASPSALFERITPAGK